MTWFPHPFTATEDGLLAIGGDLSLNRLLFAYQNGIFPWYSYPPILWWFTSPRCVLRPGNLRVSKSMKRLLRQHPYQLTINRSFDRVIHQCSHINRTGQTGTWITQDMIQSYQELHKAGYAHSAEVWDKGQLIAGLYGVAIGRIFCGESMFSTRDNASKLAFIRFHQHLFDLGFWIIDCQQETEHLKSLGAELLSKDRFWSYITENRKEPMDFFHLVNHTDKLT